MMSHLCQYRMFFILVITFMMFGIMQYSYAGNKEMRGLKVKVLLYSGIPDDTYLIVDEGQINRLKELIKKAPVNEEFGKEEFVIPAILGYKGLVIDSINIGDIPRRLLIYNGNIAAINKERVVLRDNDRAIEIYLLEIMHDKKLVTDVLLKEIKDKK